MPDTTVLGAQWFKITDALGLPENADVETVIATIEDMVTTPEPTASEVAAAAGLDETALAQLRHDAEQGRMIAAAARKRDVTEKVTAAVSRGAITPSRREHWITAIEADPLMADTLASLPDELAVPLTEIGHGQDKPDEVVEPAAWFR